jgi:predicted MFS family arabinose efflux permease
MAVQAMVSMAVLAVPSMAPAMATSLSVSTSFLGIYIAVLYVGAITASMSAGPLVLRFGAIRVSQWGLVACAAGLALVAVSSSLPLAAVGSFFIGLGYGPITPASSHVLVRTAPAHRVSLIFSIKQTGVPLGGVMAGAIVPPIVVASGVATALWSLCAACIVVAAVAGLIRRELDSDRQPGRSISLAGLSQPVKLVAGHPELRRLSTVSFVFSTMQMCLATYLVTYLNDGLGYPLVLAGLALSASQIGGVVGRIAWGWLADRWISPARMLAVLALLMGICAIATAALRPGTPVVVLLGLLTLFGASATGWNGVYLAEVARRAPPGRAGEATGGSLAFTFMGSVLGPVPLGMVAGAAGTFAASYLLMALPVLGCALWLAVRKPGPSD